MTHNWITCSDHGDLFLCHTVTLSHCHTVTLSKCCIYHLKRKMQFFQSIKLEPASSKLSIVLYMHHNLYSLYKLYSKKINLPSFPGTTSKVRLSDMNWGSRSRSCNREWLNMCLTYEDTASKSPPLFASHTRKVGQERGGEGRRRKWYFNWRSGRRKEGTLSHVLLWG